MSARYARQMILPEVGVAGQARLEAAHVLVVGAGGLGCAVLPYLTAAGVGSLTILDPDRVEESNLHRQPLYGASDCGSPKALAAASALAKLNPATRIEAQVARLSAANAAILVARATVVVDAADSFAVTYLLSDACQSLGRTLVSASVVGLTGYVGVFCGKAPSYRAVFPDLPHSAGSCAQAGVLGTAVGVMGTLQAHLALAVLLQLEPAVHGRMLTLDFRTLHVGTFSFQGTAEPAGAPLRFIDPADVTAQDVVIDLRTLSEAPHSPFAGALRVSVEALEGAGVSVAAGRRAVLCCRSGVRAWRAARALQAAGHEQLAVIALNE